MLDFRTISREARRAATNRGHDMSPARVYYRDGGIVRAEARCRRCGITYHLDTYPAPNGIDVSGEAVALNCKA